MHRRMQIVLSLAAAAALAKRCTWYEGWDYRGSATQWVGGSNASKEDCCLLCQDPVKGRNPKTGEQCAFVVWNPGARRCFLKTAGVNPFAKAGDVTCCPEGELSCPSAPAEGNWRLLPDFSDEFPVSRNGSHFLPVNKSKWATNVSSWSNWTSCTTF